MPLWKRGKPAAKAVPEPPPEPVQAASPPEAVALPELDELAALIPNRDANGRFFWQGYVDRITERFDGLPAPDGSESFARHCLAAGCRAVPVMERSSLWKRQAPPEWNRKKRTAYEVRVRLGLFVAASLRHVTHGACRLRARIGDAEWRPWPGLEPPYREFLEARASEPVVTWSEAVPGIVEVFLLAQYFLQFNEVSLLSFDLTREVYSHLRPDDPRGLFSIMLSDHGQMEEIEVDVADVFLEALAQAVGRKHLRINTRRMGHVFVHPAFWFLTSPVGVDEAAKFMHRRRSGPPHDLARREIVQALQSRGCLLGGPDNGVQTCEIYSDAWLTPLTLNGLLIKADRLPRHVPAQPFDGIINLKTAAMNQETGERKR